MKNKREKKANIVFILADDLGCWALGAAGNSEIITPNIDRLASEGQLFENCFCTSPVCSPARASILTGEMPSSHGVHDWIREGNFGSHSLDYMKESQSFTEILNDEGYTCGLSGKWHLGNSLIPQKGFKHWYAHQKGGGPYYSAPMIRNGELIHEEAYITDAITDDACDFIENQANEHKPFYISVHYTAPHSPWLNNHPEEYTALYKECRFESCPQEPDHPWIGPYDLIHSVKANLRGCLEGYFAAVTAMDQAIARIVRKLEEEGIRDNTIIIFTSDNGFNCGHHGIWGKGNGTFPLNMYDSSVKVPLIIAGSSTAKKDKKRKEFVSQYDFFPTILEAVGIIKETRGPGKSFYKLFDGVDKKWENTVVVFSEYGPTRMIRNEEWKYVHRYPYGPNELYNIKDDPEERENLYDEAQKKATISMLKEKLDEWFLTYTLPDFDGTKEPVTGHGQVFLSGRRSKGKDSFLPVQKEDY